VLRASAPGSPSQARVAPEQRLRDAYAALGLRPEASPADIKRQYKKLISENHPDKLAAKGLPASMREMVEERAREINAAYDTIKRARQL